MCKDKPAHHPPSLVNESTVKVLNQDLISWKAVTSIPHPYNQILSLITFRSKILVLNIYQTFENIFWGVGGGGQKKKKRLTIHEEIAQRMMWRWQTLSNFAEKAER